MKVSFTNNLYIHLIKYQSNWNIKESCRIENCWIELFLVTHWNTLASVKQLICDGVWRKMSLPINALGKWCLKDALNDFLTFLFYSAEECTGSRIHHFAMTRPLATRSQPDLASAGAPPSEPPAASFSAAALPSAFHVFACLTTTIILKTRVK